MIRTGRSTRVAPPDGFRFVRGSDALGEAIVDVPDRYGRRHQFSRCWTVWRSAHVTGTRSGLAWRDFTLALRDDRVVGCVACWDQRAFKQAIVRGYSGRLARWRPVLNAWSHRSSAPHIFQPSESRSHSRTSRTSRWMTTAPTSRGARRRRPRRARAGRRLRHRGRRQRQSGFGRVAAPVQTARVSQRSLRGVLAGRSRDRRDARARRSPSGGGPAMTPTRSATASAFVDSARSPHLTGRIEPCQRARRPHA